MEKNNLTDKQVWESYYKGKHTFGVINKFINKYIFDYEITKIIDRYLKNDECKSLIEMGCGGSEWLPYFAKTTNHRIYGIDYLETGCRIAEEKLKKNKVKNFEIYCGDFYEYHEWIEQKFDYVLSFGVVEHFDPPSKLIKAFGNYMKDDGLMITTCPNTKGFAMNLQKIFDKKVYDTHLKFDLKEFVEFHQEAGCKVIRATYTGFFNFNNLVFFNFSFVGRMLKIILKLFNAPVVLFFYIIKRILKVNIESEIFSSNMIVIAKISL